jgi:molybdenum cofactor synthesis domain-containing protein
VVKGFNYSVVNIKKLFFCLMSYHHVNLKCGVVQALSRVRDVRTKGFTELTRIEESLKQYFQTVELKKLPSEEISLVEAINRVLAVDVKSEVDVPPFDRSAVDGYAVKAEDTHGASQANPIVLDLTGSINAGDSLNAELKRSETIRVATGAHVPKGADAVVMLEYTEKLSDDRVEIYRPITSGYNVSKKGEDVKTGDVVLCRGTNLKPQDIGILAAMGRSDISVVNKPIIAVVSSGNELVEPGTKLEMGKIVDINRYVLISAIKDVDGNPIDMGIVGDESRDLTATISNGLERSDMVLVSGGTSVGTRDLVPEVVNSLGSPGIIVHGIAMRPGMPTALATIGSKPVILLPGHPVAALTAFNALVRPIIERLIGAPVKQMHNKMIRATVKRRIPSRSGFRDFVRVIVKSAPNGFTVEPVRVRGASVISSMVRANGILEIQEEKEGVEAGEEVEVALFRRLGEEEN